VFIGCINSGSIERSAKKSSIFSLILAFNNTLGNKVNLSNIFLSIRFLLGKEAVLLIGDLVSSILDLSSPVKVRISSSKMTISSTTWGVGFNIEVLGITLNSYSLFSHPLSL